MGTIKLRTSIFTYDENSELETILTTRGTRDAILFVFGLQGPHTFTICTQGT